MSKASIKVIALATLGAIVFFPHTALAYNWLYVSDGQQLIGMTGEEEGDTDFRASCKPNGKAEIGIGAAQDVGTGKGEAVSVTLKQGATSTRIDGVSHNSPNFEMTGGVELQTTVDAKHQIFQLLAAPGTIKLIGGQRPASWPAAGRAAATKTFLKACFGG